MINGTPRNEPQEQMAYTTSVMYTIWHSPRNKCATRMGARSNLPNMRQIPTSCIRYGYTVRGCVKAWLFQIIVFEVFNKRKQQKAFKISIWRLISKVSGHLINSHTNVNTEIRPPTTSTSNPKKGGIYVHNCLIIKALLSVLYAYSTFRSFRHL